MHEDLLYLHETFREESLHFRNVSPRTARWYRQAFLHFLNFSGADVRQISDITTLRLRDYLFAMRIPRKDGTRPWSSATFKNQYQALQSFLRWCVKQGLLPENPILPIEKPRLEKRLPKSLTHQEVERIIEYAFHEPRQYRFARYRNRAILGVFVFTGLRAQELLNLKFSHIDLDNKVIFVKQGKGNKDRMIPFCAPLDRWLREYFKERDRLKKTTAEVFCTLQGNRAFTYTGLRNFVRRIREATGVYFFPHALRHSYATLMLNGGTDVYSVSRLMGHSDIKTTTRYLSATVEHLRKESLKHPMSTLERPTIGRDFQVTHQ